MKTTTSDAIRPSIPPHSSKTRPIIFSAPMIKALLDGRKTMTRRVIKARPYNREGDTINLSVAPSASYMRGSDGRMYFQFDHPLGGPLTGLVAHFEPGDRLWCRETVACGACAPSKPSHWAASFWRREQGTTKNPNGLWYAADGLEPEKQITTRGPWVPSIHMPRWASRLTLLVESVKVERLQQISEADARAEGFPISHDGKHYDPPPPSVDSWQGYGRASFFLYWSKLHGPDALALNPWCAGITFRIIKANIDSAEARNV